MVHLFDDIRSLRHPEKCYICKLINFLIPFAFDGKKKIQASKRRRNKTFRDFQFKYFIEFAIVLKKNSFILSDKPFKNIFSYFFKDFRQNFVKTL